MGQHWEGPASLTVSSGPAVPLPAPQTLQKLKVPIIDSQVCGQLYWRGAGQGTITDDMLCAGYLEGKRDACLVSARLGPAAHRPQRPLSAGSGCIPGVVVVGSLLLPDPLSKPRTGPALGGPDP